MKRKLFILIIIVLILSIYILFKFINNSENTWYKEIEKAFEKAIIWNLDATFNNQKDCSENISKEFTITADELISNGYLKKTC